MASAFGVTLKKNVQSGLIFSLGNLNSMKTLKGEGACCAIVADFISRSKKMGREVKSASELSPPTAYVVAFGPDDFHTQVVQGHPDINIMNSFSLEPHEIKHFEPVTVSSMATFIASKTGYLWLHFFGSSGGHSVGFHIQGSNFDYLDPNVGLFRCLSAGAFTSHLTTELSTKYPGLTSWAKLYDFV